jgi:hypothetical protein
MSLGHNKEKLRIGVVNSIPFNDKELALEKQEVICCCRRV